MHLQPPDAAVALGPFDDFAERNGGGIDQPQHLATLAPHQPVGQPRQPGEGLAEDRQRAAGIGIGQGRARQRADSEMVVVMGVGVPRRLQGAQTRDPAKDGQECYRCSACPILSESRQPESSRSILL